MDSRNLGVSNRCHRAVDFMLAPTGLRSGGLVEAIRKLANTNVRRSASLVPSDFPEQLHRVLLYARRMRVVIVACVLLATQSASAGPKKLAVPWIEAGPEDDEDVEHLAATLTTALRAQVHADQRYELPTDERTLADVKRHAKCEVVKTACLVVIAKELGGDTMIFGRLERNVLDGVEGYDISLELLTVSNRSRRQWNARAPLTSITTSLAQIAPTAYAALAGAPRLPPPARLAVPACTSKSHQAIADAYATRGHFAAALLEYEAAYQCDRDAMIAARIFLTACNVKDATKALHYYALVPPNMRYLRQRCVAYGIQVP